MTAADILTCVGCRDVPARYLLRLGMGEAELETEQDFSRVGRVNAMLARRLELLAQVGFDYCSAPLVSRLPAALGGSSRCWRAAWSRWPR